MDISAVGLFLPLSGMQVRPDPRLLRIWPQFFQVFLPKLFSLPAMIKVNSYRLPALFFFHLTSLPHEANDSSMLSVADVRPPSKGMVNFRDNKKGTFATCYSWSGHNVIPPERRNRCQHTPAVVVGTSFNISIGEKGQLWGRPAR